MLVGFLTVGICGGEVQQAGEERSEGGLTAFL